MPRADTHAMNAHLAEIGLAVEPGAHAVVMLDQAGWHTSSTLEVPGNITLMALPPRSPELNPVENVWQFMRDNWLSNRVFQSYDDILDQCCEAWNKLVSQPGRIASIGTRKWAMGSETMTAGITPSGLPELTGGIRAAVCFGKGDPSPEVMRRF